MRLTWDNIPSIPQVPLSTVPPATPYSCMSDRFDGAGRRGASSPDSMRASGGRPRGWTGLSDEGVAHNAERWCSEGKEGFVEAPEREFRTPGG